MATLFLLFLSGSCGTTKWVNTDNDRSLSSNTERTLGHGPCPSEKVEIWSKDELGPLSTHALKVATYLKNNKEQLSNSIPTAISTEGEHYGLRTSDMQAGLMSETTQCSEKIKVKKVYELYMTQDEAFPLGHVIRLHSMMKDDFDHLYIYSPSGMLIGKIPVKLPKIEKKINPWGGV
jgi:hypothetical protein